MRVKLVVAWFDLWIGAYWDQAQRRLFILPIPCVGVAIQFKPKVRACPSCDGQGGWKDDFDENGNSSSTFRAVECPECCGLGTTNA